MPKPSLKLIQLDDAIQIKSYRDCEVDYGLRTETSFFALFALIN